MKTVHRFTYPISARRDHVRLDEGDDSTRHVRSRSKLHWLRDGDAGTHYATTLAAAGYRFSLELNLPVAAAHIHLNGERAMAAEQRLKRGDIILLNTRPPLSEDANQLITPIGQSNSWVEKKILDFLRQSFSTCSRDEVVLSPELAVMLPVPFQKHARLKFKARSDAACVQKASVDGQYEEIHSHRTVGYLVYGREIWPNGPDLLCSFAMSGPMNLIWAYLMCKRFPDHVLSSNSERFLMAAFGPVTQPHGQHRTYPDAPETLQFTDHWNFEVVLDRSAPKLWL